MRFVRLTLLSGAPVAIALETIKQVCGIPSVENSPACTRLFVQDGSLSGRYWDVKETVDEVLEKCL